MANAILMASGLGSRMRPLTNDKPKPLIDVCGKPMIETVIAGLQYIGVENIYIVVGYLGEQFGYLTEKYDNIYIIRNDVYETINNISSVYYAREVLRQGDCYVCEADLYIKNPEVFGKTPDRSCYFGKMVKGYSDDWVFEQEENGYISRVGKGGTDCYNMVGIAYLAEKDGKILADAIEEAYGKDDYEDMFWDDVVNNNLDKLKLVVTPVEEGSIIEIDTVDELMKVRETMAEL
ncbi:MAG: sugar phosphate nucleotidyltransferase [Wujia sp.]